MALVILMAITRGVDGSSVSRIQQKLRELDVRIAFAVTFHVVDEPSESDERLLHLLMAVVPRFLRTGAEIVAPAIRKFLSRVVQPCILLFRHQVVVDGGLDEVSGNISFVIAAMSGFPVFELAAFGDSSPALGAIEGEGRLEIAVWFLRGQD